MAGILAQEGVRWEKDDTTGKIVVHGDLDLSEKGLTELPDLSHVVVEGRFDCSHNQLTSLVGTPQIVGGGLWCDNNQLTSIEGAPQTVGGLFMCRNNPIIHLSPNITYLAIQLCGYRSPETLAALQNIPEPKKIHLNKIHLNIETGDKDFIVIIANIQDFARELTEHLVLPLYVRDYAKQTNQPVTEALLYALKDNIPPDTITNKLLPIVMQKLLLDGNDGKTRTIEQIMGLSETWHTLQFPDRLRPDKAKGNWHPLTTETTYAVPAAALPKGSSNITCTVLTSDKELHQEGKVMRHCVGDGGYTTRCLEGTYHVVSIRKEGESTPLSTLGITLDDDGKAQIAQNHSVENSAPCEAAQKAAEWLVEQINNKKIPLNEEFGETAESKAQQKVSNLQRKIGYLPTAENIQQVFAEYNLSKRNARVLDEATGKWSKRPSRHSLIGGMHTASKPKALFSKRGEALQSTKDTGYRELPVEQWFEVSGLRDALRNHPFLPHPSPEELAAAEKENRSTPAGRATSEGTMKWVDSYKKNNKSTQSHSV